MSGHLRSRAKRTARKHQLQVVRDHGSLKMAQMPWRIHATFGHDADLLTTLETIWQARAAHSLPGEEMQLVAQQTSGNKQKGSP